MVKSKGPRDGITHVASLLCPDCGYHCTAFGSVDGAPVGAEPGDATVCLNCGSLAIISDKMGLRKPTAEDLAAIAADPEWTAEVKQTQLRIQVMQALGFQTKQAQRGRGPAN